MARRISERVQSLLTRRGACLPSMLYARKVVKGKYPYQVWARACKERPDYAAKLLMWIGAESKRCTCGRKDCEYGLSGDVRNKKFPWTKVKPLLLKKLKEEGL